MTDNKENEEAPVDKAPKTSKPTPKKKAPAKPKASKAKPAEKAADTENPQPEAKDEEHANEENMTDTTEDKEYKKPGMDRGIWLRGLWMIVLALLFAIAETVLLAAAVIQFFWILFAKEKNQFVADFGKDLSTWLSKTAKFQTGASEEKPFPWTSWKS